MHSWRTSGSSRMVSRVVSDLSRRPSIGDSAWKAKLVKKLINKTLHNWKECPSDRM